jgi:hypothetical protein
MAPAARRLEALILSSPSATRHPPSTLRAVADDVAIDQVDHVPDEVRGLVADRSRLFETEISSAPGRCTPVHLVELRLDDQTVRAIDLHVLVADAARHLRHLRGIGRVVPVGLPPLFQRQPSRNFILEVERTMCLIR